MGWKGWLLSHVEWVRSLEAHWSVCSLQSKNASFTKFLELYGGLWGTVHVALECPLTFLRSKHHHACHGSYWERWPEALDLCWMRCQPLPLGCWDEVKWRCWRNRMAKLEPQIHAVRGGWLVEVCTSNQYLYNIYSWVLCCFRCVFFGIAHSKNHQTPFRMSPNIREIIKLLTAQGHMVVITKLVCSDRRTKIFIAERLSLFVRVLALPQRVVFHHFSPLLHASRPSLLHAFMVVNALFAEVDESPLKLEFERHCNAIHLR